MDVARVGGVGREEDTRVAYRSPLDFCPPDFASTVDGKVDGGSDDDLILATTFGEHLSSGMPNTCGVETHPRKIRVSQLERNSRSEE